MIQIHKDSLTPEIQAKMSEMYAFQSNEEIEEVGANQFIPFEISFNQDDHNASYHLLAGNEDTFELFYADKIGNAVILTLDEIWQLSAQGKLFANYGYSYMSDEDGKQTAINLAIPYQIYVGRLDQAKEYAAKCIAENRPSIDIMKLVGYRQDGLVMYGTNTATGGTVSTILAVTVLKTMLDENKLVDYKELIS